MRNNTWRNNRKFAVTIGGHFANLNFTDSLLEENECLRGLISIQGMEKQLRIVRNTMEKNVGQFIIEFRADSQSEIVGETKADFKYNSLRRNRPLDNRV